MSATTCQDCAWRPPTTTVLDRSRGLLFLCEFCATKGDPCPGCHMPFIDCKCEPTPRPAPPIKGDRDDIDF